jgi:hypothetical protein
MKEFDVSDMTAETLESLFVKMDVRPLKKKGLGR